MTFRLDVDFSEVKKLEGKFANFNEIAAKEINTAMLTSLELFRGEVVPRVPVNFGTLRQSVQTISRGRPVKTSGEVSTPLVYGAPVEYGRQPGKMPPVEAIEIWVRRKLGIGGNEAKSVAFLIARSIGRKGTRGAHMFEQAFEAGLPGATKIWRNVPKRIIRKVQS